MQNLATGLSTTVIGIVLVTSILALISFCIDSVHHLPFIANETPKQQEAPAPPEPPVPAYDTGDPELMGNRELMAVVLAAIAASTNVPMENLTVRSIRASK